jgi:hypothetical protein
MKFRKKPITIEAVQWTGENKNDMEKFIDRELQPIVVDKTDLIVYTLEGIMRANPGDWVIKGIVGEFYPCKPDIFEKTYEKVDEDWRIAM